MPQLGRADGAHRARRAGRARRARSASCRAASSSASSCRTARRAATSARTTGSTCGCRISGRSARSAWRTRATSWRRSRRSRIAKATSASSRSIGGGLWEAEIDHSPLDIVAWRGNYVPFKYDLNRFQCINTVTFDHPDPSIYCVLASPTAVPGTSNIEFGCFPPRWSVAEHTFRPPPFHRNVASEFLGLDLRPVHRQGRRLRARQRQPAQLHVGPRARCRGVRARRAAPS